MLCCWARGIFGLTLHLPCLQCLHCDFAWHFALPFTPRCALPFTPCCALPFTPRCALPFAPCCALPFAPRCALPFASRCALPFTPCCALPFALPSACPLHCLLHVLCVAFCIVVLHGLVHCPFAWPAALLSACLQCVDMMRSCYGNDDIRVGAALHNMAGLYLSTKPPDYSHAETILREALDVSPFLTASHLLCLIAPLVITAVVGKHLSGNDQSFCIKEVVQTTNSKE